MDSYIQNQIFRRQKEHIEQLLPDAPAYIDLKEPPLEEIHQMLRNERYERVSPLRYKFGLIKDDDNNTTAETPRPNYDGWTICLKLSLFCLVHFFPELAIFVLIVFLFM